jgi:hypothetical protein
MSTPRAGILYTFGYDGITDSVKLRQLIGGHDIAEVVDVRLRNFGKAPFTPWDSRKTVEAVVPGYRHSHKLGNLLYKVGGTQIKDIEAIEEVLDTLRGGYNIALMCVCAKPESCHRWTLVEEALRRMPDLQVIHLTKRGPRPHVRPVKVDQLDLADALLPLP